MAAAICQTCANDIAECICDDAATIDSCDDWHAAGAAAPAPQNTWNFWKLSTPKGNYDWDVYQVNQTADKISIEATSSQVVKRPAYLKVSMEKMTFEEVQRRHPQIAFGDTGPTVKKILVVLNMQECYVITTDCIPLDFSIIKKYIRFPASEFKVQCAALLEME